MSRSIKFDEPLYQSKGSIRATPAVVMVDRVQVAIAEYVQSAEFPTVACATLTVDQVDELIQQLQKAKEVAR